LAEDDSAAAADSLDADVAGIDDAASQDEDATTDDRSANVLQNCFATILDTLASNNPRFNSVLLCVESQTCSSVHIGYQEFYMLLFYTFGVV